jgi:hypothetical protein
MPAADNLIEEISERVVRGHALQHKTYFHDMQY